MSHVRALPYIFFFFFFNDTATTEIYTLSLHDALPISLRGLPERQHHARGLEDRAEPFHSAVPLRRDRDETGGVEASLQLDVAHRGVPDRRERRVPRREREIGRASCRGRV